MSSPSPLSGALMKASLLKLDWLIRPLSLVVELTHRGQGVTTSSNCLTMWVCPCRAVPSLKTPCEYEFGWELYPTLWLGYNQHTHYPGSPDRVRSMPGTGIKTKYGFLHFRPTNMGECQVFSPLLLLAMSGFLQPYWKDNILNTCWLCFIANKEPGIISQRPEEQNLKLN